jgi:hypothetical protein
VRSEERPSLSEADCEVDFSESGTTPLRGVSNYCFRRKGERNIPSELVASVGEGLSELGAGGLCRVGLHFLALKTKSVNIENIGGHGQS